MRLLALCVCALTCVVTSRASCDVDDVAVYRVRLETFWTEDRFPKNYPMIRPRAQWAQLFGQSHNGSHRLYHLGEVAPEQLRDYAETGQISGLERAGELDDNVYDQFTASPIPKGKGASENVFFVDGRHSLVSLVCRLVPSPDWFVGVDSLQLCVDSLWIDEASLSLEPMDAGAASGLSFESVPARTSPPAPVTRVTARGPAHPAAAFYYPAYRHLPTIAAVHFTKIKEYSSKEINDMVHSEVRQELNSDEIENVEPGQPPFKEVSTRSSLEVLKDLEEEPVGRPKSSLPSDHVEIITEDSVSKSRAEGEFGARSADEVVLAVARGKLAGRRGKHLPRHFRHRLNKAVNRVTVEDCVVSDWSAWSPCTASCGVGARVRTRRVLRAPAPRARACPALWERQPCGQEHACLPQDFSQW